MLPTRISLILLQFVFLVSAQELGEKEIQRYLYDASMMSGDVPLLKCPDLKIVFSQISHDFKYGDKLYVRLRSYREQDQERLLWYYPPAHEKGLSFAQRTLRKFTGLSLDFRFKKVEVWQKRVKYPTVRFVSNDILGNARSKVGPTIRFPRRKPSREFYIFTEQSMDYRDFIRLRNLYFTVEDVSSEIGPTVIECSKNGKNWKQLGNLELVVGRTRIASIAPKRFLRLKDQTFPVTIELEVGEYPTIGKGKLIELELSNELDIQWTEQSEGEIVILSHQRKTSMQAPVSVSGKSLFLEIPSKIPPRSTVFLKDLYLTSTVGPQDRTSTGEIRLYGKLSGNFDVQSPEKRTQLGKVSDEISLLYPKAVLTGRENLIFFLKSDRKDTFSLRLTNDNNSTFLKGDKVQLIIPDDVEVTWSSKSVVNRSKGYRLARMDQKTLAIDVLGEVGSTLQIDNLEFQKPTKSISPFFLQLQLPFDPNNSKLKIPKSIVFGQPHMSMEKQKLVNRQNGSATLNAIVLVEDGDVTTLRKNSKIEIIADTHFFHFNVSKISDIVILATAGSKSDKFFVNYTNSSPERIVLYTRSDLRPKEALVIKDIPITNFVDVGSNVHLRFDLNDKCLLVDETEIRFFDLTVDMQSDVEFIRDVSKPNSELILPPATIAVSGVGKMLNKGDKLVLSIPNEIGRWGDPQGFRLTAHGSSGRNAVRIIQSHDLSNKLVFSLSEDLYDDARIVLERLSIIPSIDEFIGQNLMLFLASDSTVATVTTKSITLSYPSIVSLVHQTFFTDDTSWALYNFILNTRNLNQSFPQGSLISIILADKEVEWDSKNTEIQILGENSDRLSTSVSYELERCNILVLDSLKSGVSFEISGLRFQPVRRVTHKFSLQLSLDQGNTICANDRMFKKVLPETEYSSKIERSLDVARYAMKTGKTWRISIPEPALFEWDTTAQQVRPALAQGGIRLGNFVTESLSSTVDYIDTRTAKITIVHGYKTISQGLELSGSSPKRIMFDGLKIKKLGEGDPAGLRTHFELTVETPYGFRTIRSDEFWHPNWGLKINNNRHFVWDGSTELSSIPVTVQVSMPAVVDPSDARILSVDKLVIYDDVTLLRRPLIDEFESENSDKAKRDILQSAELIGKLYDTPEKGRDWKTWYYLAWAKKRASDLDIFDEFIQQFDPVIEKSLMREGFLSDLDKAKRKGYNPEGLHHDYRSIEKENIYAELKDKLRRATRKVERGDYLTAEKEFLSILDQTKKDETIRNFSSVANYWLGKISLFLEDVEYDNYRQSYAYKKLTDAQRIYEEYRPILSQYDPTLLDSIKTYRKKAMSLKRSTEDVSLKRLSPIGKSRQRYGDNLYTFTYKQDNEYTFEISGKGAFDVIVLSEDKNQLFEGNEVRTDFDSRIQLNPGGQYDINFSPSKQGYMNIFTTAIILGLLLIFYV